MTGLILGICDVHVGVHSEAEILGKPCVGWMVYEPFQNPAAEPAWIEDEDGKVRDDLTSENQMSERVKCRVCGESDILYSDGQAGWVCPKHRQPRPEEVSELDDEPVTLSDFIEAYEEYDGDDVTQLIHEWAERLGIEAH
jgi:hypothetical protein